MVKSFSKRYRKFRFIPHRPNTSGFTLLELLVAMVVGGLISAGLLFIVVQLIQTNLRESARSDTQRDLQAAIDYIARDVREAVFVYDARCLGTRPATNPLPCPGLRNYLPDRITNNTQSIPVLAFWRLDELPQKLKEACSDPENNRAYSQSVTQLPDAIKGVPCLSGRMYTLVVYSLSQEQGAVAKGRARIMRYTLPQFTSSSTDTSPPTIITGWANPIAKDTSFLAWPVDKSTVASATPTSLQIGGRPTAIDLNEVLTDYVDWLGLYEASDRGRAPDRSTESLILTPQNGATATGDPPRGFYVYVRGGEREGDLNQEVIIRIQGDAAGRPGIPNVGSNRPVVPISLETRVLARGVTNKTQ